MNFIPIPEPKDKIEALAQRIWSHDDGKEQSGGYGWIADIIREVLPTIKVEPTTKPGQYTDIENRLMHEFSNYYLDKYFPKFNESETRETIEEKIKQYHDAYTKANRDLQQLGITRFIYDSTTGIITIYLNRPGLFIGVRGENLDKIDVLFKNIEPTYKKIKIIEDRINEYLHCMDYSYMDDEEF